MRAGLASFLFRSLSTEIGVAFRTNVRGGGVVVCLMGESVSENDDRSNSI